MENKVQVNQEQRVGLHVEAWGKQDSDHHIKGEADYNKLGRVITKADQKSTRKANGWESHAGKGEHTQKVKLVIQHNSLPPLPSIYSWKSKWKISSFIWLVDD